MRGPESPFLIDLHLEEKLKNIVEDALKSREDLFFTDIKISGKGGLQKVSILVDGDQGVSIEDCSKISRAVAAKLDEENLMSGKYNLEVSSPGVDNPLKTTRQYNKNIGRQLKVTLIDGGEINGVLREVTETSISMEKEVKINKQLSTEVTEVPFNNIKKAKVLISF